MKDRRSVALAAAAEAVEGCEAVATLLSGSIARGDAVASSDVDLLLVTVDGAESGMRREVREGVLVERVAYSEAEWRERFSRPTPRWLYAFLEAQILHDDSGIARRLISQAADARSSYRTPSGLLHAIAVEFWHGQAKLDRALTSPDPLARGYQASVAVDWIIDALFAVHHTPLPSASRRLHYLAGISLEPEVERNWSVLLTGDVDARLLASASLIAWLRAKLPTPRLDAPDSRITGL